MNPPVTVRNNPGPRWGYGFLLWAERWWPRPLFRLGLMAGTGVALAFMPAERAASRNYLRLVLGRTPRVLDVWRHFFAFADFLVRKLRAGRGVPLTATLGPEHAAEFEALLQSDRPALFGTFHFGCSDLLGYLLGARGRRVAILRQRVGHSADTRLLGDRFGDKVSFLWINDPANLLFELKAALEGGESLAMKCDRLEFSAKTEPFHFLGAPRRFPFTIYHLAVLFDRPVVFCTAVPDAGPDAMRVSASPVFWPRRGAGREANLASAREHFQAELGRLETMVRQHPLLWFNFLPLNPEEPPAARGHISPEP